MAEAGNYMVCVQSAQPSGHRGIQLPTHPDLSGRTPVPEAGMPIEVHADVPAPHIPQSRDGASAKSTPMHAELARNFKLLVDSQVEILGPPIDAAGNETDSDERDNGDCEEVETFVSVVGSCTTNSSRSASISSVSFTPPTPITTVSNAFEALSSDFTMPVALNSWDVRRYSPKRGADTVVAESVTGEFVERSTRLARHSAT